MHILVLYCVSISTCCDRCLDILIDCVHSCILYLIQQGLALQLVVELLGMQLLLCLLPKGFTELFILTSGVLLIHFQICMLVRKGRKLGRTGISYWISSPVNS